MGSSERPRSSEVIAALADPETFRSWDEPVEHRADDDYAQALRLAEQRSGTDEALITGTVELDGVTTAVIVGEFGFLAGSVGLQAARRLVAAVHRATAERLPLLAAPVSGGTRMQEGTPAFVQMVPIAAAVAAHRRAGLPYLVWLRDPTTGGVMATWGSLGQATAAAPGALAGFLGPRVFRAMTGEDFPAGVQTAESLAEGGIIDAVVPIEALRAWVGGLISAMTAARGYPRPTNHVEDVEFGPVPDAWDCVTSTRREGRPGARELLAVAATDLTWLSGTGAGERDDAVALAVCRIAGVGCVVAAQDRSADTPVGPAALRTARRAYSLASELDLPVITVVDTEGAELSEAAERGALAGEIARSLAQLSELQVPVVSLLLGSGCGGAALAMLPGDIVLAASDAWVTPLPPEGASAILHRTTARAADLARSQHITAVELAHLGVVDRLVGAPDFEPAKFVAEMGAALAESVLGARVTARRVDRFLVDM